MSKPRPHTRHGVWASDLVWSDSLAIHIFINSNIYTSGRLSLALEANNGCNIFYLQSIIQPNSSGIICWRCSLQLSVQTVHHKQEVGLKHCKTEHLVRSKLTLYNKWCASNVVTHIKSCWTYKHSHDQRYCLVLCFVDRASGYIKLKKNQPDAHFLLSIFFQIPLHISEEPTAHYQEVQRMDVLWIDPKHADVFDEIDWR